MNQGVKTLIFPVKDIERAKALYGVVFGAPVVDEAYYVGYRVGDQDIGLDPNGHAQGMTGPVAYAQVDDIRRSLQSILSAGATVVSEVRDVGGGKLIASVRDADGNVMGLMQSS